MKKWKKDLKTLTKETDAMRTWDKGLKRLSEKCAEEGKPLSVVVSDFDTRRISKKFNAGWLRLPGGAVGQLHKKYSGENWDIWPTEVFFMKEAESRTLEVRSLKVERAIILKGMAHDFPFSDLKQFYQAVMKKGEKSES